MHFNRLRGYLSECRPTRFSYEFEAEERRPKIDQGFVACPIAFLPAVQATPGDWRASVLRLAYEQAQAAVAARQEAREGAYPWN
jgi:hypothetical protein